MVYSRDTEHCHVTNFVTNLQIDLESCTFLHECLKLGEDAYQNFYKIWFIDKTERLFDTIPKMKTSKGWRPTIQAYDLTLL